MAPEALEVGDSPDAVPTARRYVVAALAGVGPEEVVFAAELVVSELVTNALLHAGPPAELSVTVNPNADGVRVAVRDSSRSLPVRPHRESEGMTGRGLALIDALSAAWGVEPLPTGKTVWADLTPASIEQEAPADVDPDLLLASFDDWPDEPSRERFTVTLGDVPTDLLIAAKGHVDSVIRELLLSATGASSGQSAALPPHLVELVNGVVMEFAEARQSIKRQALGAAERGEERTRLTLTLPADAADAGERYLAALEEADAYAKSARLLTLAAPAQHSAFRRWYVTSLVSALRAAAQGLPARPGPSFEDYLLDRVDELARLQQVSDRAARLQRITAALASTLRPEDAAKIALDDAMAELGAARGCLVLAGADEISLAAYTGYSPEVAAELERTWRAGAEVPTVHTYRTGEPVWIESRTERDAIYPVIATVEPDVAALCTVPSSVAGHVVGILRLGFLESRLFGEDERAFLTALGAVLAQALERTRLYESQARVADRLTRLQSVTAALAKARSLDEVLDVTISQARGLVGAYIASLCLLDDDGHTVRMVRIHPPLAPDAGNWDTFQLDDDLPASESIRTGELIWVGSLAERNTRWPALSAVTSPIDRTLVVLPLHAENATVGALTLSFPRGEQRQDADAAHLTAFADACAQAIERARSADRTAAVRGKLEFLARASAELAASLDIQRTLASVARLAVPEMADWCVVHLLEDAELTCVAVEHIDPAKRGVALEAQRRWPERLSDPHGVAAVVRSGESIMVPDIPAVAAHYPVERHPEHQAVLDELDLFGAIVVPLSARGRTLGAMTFISAESRRVYDEDDLSLAEDLARRAAVAIDNASLFRQLTAGSALAGFGGRPKAATDVVDLELALAAAEVGRFELFLAEQTIVADERLVGFFAFPPHTAGMAMPFADYLERLHPEDRERVEAAVADAVGRRGDFASEHRILLPDRSVRWISVRGRIVCDAAGEPVSLPGVSYDTTRVRDSRDELARLLETMSDAFFRLDRDWRFTYVNRQAERMLFHQRDELLGKSVWDTYPEARGTAWQTHYERAMRDGTQVIFEEYFIPLSAWFEVRASPDASGLSVFFHDVTARKLAERAREAAGDRLALLGEAARELVGTLEPDTVLQRVSGVLVPRLADWAVCLVVDRNGQLQRAVGRHRDQALSDRLTEQLALGSPSADAALAALSPVLSTGEQRLWGFLDPDVLAAPLGGGEPARVLADMGLESVLAVPLQSGSLILGVLCLGVGPERPAFGPDDLTTAADVGRRAGLALDNANLYERQRRAAEVLQRSLLTPVPAPDHLQIVPRYRPASLEAAVGGDWYDAFLQPGGATMLAIGDVVGHDMSAAAAMGQLRNLLRGVAFDRDETPAGVLTRVDAAIRGLQLGTLATAVVGRIEQSADQRTRSERTFRWSNAGHPPPLLLRAGGRVELLESEDGLLLGLDPAAVRLDHEIVIRPGDTLLLYTDGLVERRDSPIEEGLSGLRSVMSELASLPLVELCDQLLARLLPAHADDDVALVALRAFDEDRPRPAEAGPERVPPAVPRPQPLA